MIDPNIDGIVPNERLHDMRRDLRSSVGGGLGGSGPRGEGVFLINEKLTRGASTYTVTKSWFKNPTGKASYGIRIGDVIIFSDIDKKTGKGQLCAGLVTKISGDNVTFTKESIVTTEGFSPTITVSDVIGGHQIKVTNDNGTTSTFLVMDGEKGDKGDSFEFDDFTAEQLADLRSDISSLYFKKREALIVADNVPIDRIPIPFTDYTSGDIMFVDIEGLSLMENTDYVVDGDHIRLVTSPTIVHEGAVIHFKLLKAIAMTTQDIENIVAGSIIDDVVPMVVSRISEFPTATQSTNGLMSSEDKEKLDSIAIEGRMTSTGAGYQRVKVGYGYADVPMINPNTGLIDDDNLPHPCGSTRPRDPIDGTSFFDTNLKQPIWYYGGAWYAADGAVVQ